VLDRVTMADRRSTLRHRTFKGGRIITERPPTATDCLVRNLSDFGACLEIGNSLVPMNEFNLVIKPENFVRICRVVWRKPQKIGVRFVV
jgi:hypothetical protein